MTNLPAPSWSRTNPNDRPTELYSPAMMHPQWATSVRHVTMERDAIPVFAHKETAKWAQVRVVVTSEAMFSFYSGGGSRSHGTLNFQNLQQGFLSNHGSARTIPTVGTRFNVKVLPVTVVLVPRAWFPPWNCTKQGPTHVPRWFSSLVVLDPLYLSQFHST